MDKKLGKIEKVSFGLGGYQRSCIGLNITLSGNHWVTYSGRTAWDKNLIKCSDHCKWTEEDRSDQYNEIVRHVSDLLAAAKVDSVDKLKGIPVEVVFEGNLLKSWRVLSEVI